MSRRSAVASEEVGRIVQATFDVIADSQSPEPSLREVLRRARLSTATFYRYFRSRDELILVVLDEGSWILTSYLEHRMAGEADPVAKVSAWIKGFLHQAESPTAADRTRPFAVGSARVESQFPVEHRRLDERMVKLLEDQIVAGNETGMFNSLDPERDAWVILDFIRAGVLHHILARTKPSKQTIDHAVSAALRILGAS